MSIGLYIAIFSPCFQKATTSDQRRHRGRAEDAEGRTERVTRQTQTAAQNRERERGTETQVRKRELERRLMIKDVQI